MDLAMVRHRADATAEADDRLLYSSSRQRAGIRLPSSHPGSRAGGAAAGPLPGFRV